MGIINNKHKNLRNRKEEFFNAEPFPYIVIDDFLESEFFGKLKSVFDDNTIPIAGRSFDTDVEKKKWISLNSSLPEVINQIVNELNANEWLENVRGLTEIDSIVATSYGNTELANYHVMEPGAFLGAHVDHSHEPVKGIPHVLNTLIHLTESWDESDGGATFFYDNTGKEIIAKVPYKQNRAVIFLHTPYSFHSVERININAKKKRRTIYVDYYSDCFQPYEKIKLNFSSRWFKHGTTFRLDNYFDYCKSKNYHYTKAMLKYQINKARMEFNPFQ